MTSKSGLVTLSMLDQPLQKMLNPQCHVSTGMLTLQGMVLAPNAKASPIPILSTDKVLCGSILT